MKLIKDIFARIWAFWAVITFIITFLLVFLPSMVAYLYKDEYKGQVYFLNVSSVWMRIWLWMIACPVKIYGKENFKEGDNYIVVYNHNALLDAPLSAPFIPGANKTIAKASFAKVPVFKWFYQRGSVLIDRKDDSSRRKSFDAMKKVLQSGMHMCIYPEGTRNRTNQPLKSFHDGAFKLATDSKKQIIPGIIVGTKKAMPIDKPFYLLPTRLKMYFLPPISSENITTAELKSKVFEVMKDAYLTRSSKQTV